MTELTAARLRELLHYDAESGNFSRLVRASCVPAGSNAGHVNREGYVTISIDGTAYLAHRLAVLYMFGRWPDQQVDHRDGVRSNNRWANLREASVAENATNRRNPSSHTSSGLLGAKLVKSTGRWRADITIKGVYTYLGTFATPEEAHSAFLKAKRANHPFCTI